MRSTVLITGVAGFLGSHLADRLLADGFEVVGIDNLMTGSLANLSKAMKDSRFHFQIGDVREPLECCAKMIYNLACPASPTHYQKDPFATFTTSVIGAQRLIEMAQGRECRVVHASTSEVYGDPEVHPQPESYRGSVNTLGPRSCYDEGKRGAETLLNDAYRKSGLDVRIVRIFNTYGPRMALNDGRVVSKFIAQAVRDKPITVHGSGRQTRSFCYVDDMIDGLVRAMASGPLWGAINLGDPGFEIAILDLAKLVIDLVGSSSSVVHDNDLEDDPKRRCPNIERATRLLGFSPKWRLGDGLKQTIEDIRGRL